MKIRGIVPLVLALFTAGPAFSMSSPASAQDGFTLLVVPDRLNTLELGRDIHNRYPSLLLTYEFPGNPKDPYLHILKEEAWVQVSSESFSTGAFLREKPSRVVVVGDDNAQTQALIETAKSWSPEVLNAPAAKSAEMLNTIGKSLGFSKSDYRYFARRHGFEIEDINAERSKESWYDQPPTRALGNTDASLSAAFSRQENAPDAPATRPVAAPGPMGNDPDAAPPKKPLDKAITE